MDKSNERIDDRGLEANTAVTTTLGMKNKCCVNVNAYFEIVHVCIRAQQYPPFPINSLHIAIRK